jgi:hypothetical protein
MLKCRYGEGQEVPLPSSRSWYNHMSGMEEILPIIEVILVISIASIVG